MRAYLFVLIYLWVIAFLCPCRADSGSVVESVRPGDYEDELIVGELKRSYLVHVPKGYKGEVLPVVIVFHGGLADARMSQWNARMIEKSDKDKFFVVYPHGSNGVGKHLLTWNAGTCCGLASKNNADDVGFVRLMIAKLKKDYPIDPLRVYVTGMSNGAMMAYRVACELPELIAAAAPVEGCMLSRGGIIGTAPVSIIAFNGTEDRVIKYDGGEGSFLGYKVRCPGVKETMRLWAEHDHCYPFPKLEKEGELTRELYSEGDEGTEVCLITLNAGHTWPGGRSKLPFQKNTEFSATDAMCEFFWKHPKQKAKTQ